MSYVTLGSIKEMSYQPIDAQGICDIIKAAKRSGVKSIKYGDLSIDFGEESDSIARIDQHSLQEIDRKDEVASTSDDVDDMESMLLLEDPERYEQLQLGEDQIV